MDWLPMIGNFSYNHPIGNHTVPEPSTTGTDRSVQEFLDLSPWLQIQVVMATTEGEAWTLPDMDKVSWGMEEVVFTHIGRTELQSYGQPLNLTTLIDVEEDWSGGPRAGRGLRARAAHRGRGTRRDLDFEQSRGRCPGRAHWKQPRSRQPSGSIGAHVEPADRTRR